MMNETVARNTGYFFFIVIALSVCISKAAVNISYGVVIFATIIYLSCFYSRIDFRNTNRYVLVLLFPFAVGFIASFFSLSGVSSFLAFIARFRFFLLILSFALFVDSEKKLNGLIIALNISAFVSVVYGLTQLDFSELWGKIVGFHNLLRGSELLAYISMINITGFFLYRHKDGKSHKLFNTVIFFNTVLMFFGIAVMGRRGTILGLLMGGGVLLITMMLVMRKGLVLAAVMVVVCLSMIFSDGWLGDRVRSIKDWHNNESNEVRIMLIEFGVDYIIDEHLFLRGTGAKKSRKLVGDYFNSKPEEYREKYNAKYKGFESYFGNFHNSFLQMAIEGGALFLFLFLLCFFSIMFFLFKNMKRLEGNRKFYPMSALAVTAACFSSQFFYNDLFMYAGIPCIIMLSGGCYVSMVDSKEKTEEESTNPPRILYGPNGPEFHKA